MRPLPKGGVLTQSIHVTHATATGRQHDTRILQAVGLTCDTAMVHARRTTAYKGPATLYS